jgi:hypothetical protein
MELYKTHRPTGFDNAGVGSESHGIGEFLVLLGRNRDSDILTESNFAQALQALGGESNSVQVHRFGHWACGWYELILIDPSDAAALAIAEDIEASLSDYPVLNDEDFSNREYEIACQQWQRESVSERVSLIQRYGRSERVSVFAARHDELPEGLYYSDWVASC